MAASPVLHVIALVSGGKDSLYSMLHCLANGHQIVALANLHPLLSGTDANGDEDANSYMYQTVGHSVIPLYEEALGIPLYRQEILGSAVNSQREYLAPTDQQDGDETEDLFALLHRIKEKHPDANAVSTGAILSTYQRTRVESVASRLGLTPLSFLWQYPSLPPYKQSALLDHMAQVGQESRLVKVASGGLDASFLWENLADSKFVARLSKAMGRFADTSSGSLLGEGGEYETLALDGPSALWGKRIEVNLGDIVTQEGGTAVMKISKAKLVSKTQAWPDLHIPLPFDDEFAAVFRSLDKFPYCIDEAPVDFERTTPCVKDANIRETASTWTYANAVSSNNTYTNAGSASLQLKEALERIEASLNNTGSLTKAHISHCTMILRDMDSFAAANTVYQSFFKDMLNPPSRVTLAIGSSMPPNLEVMLTATIDKTPSREALHVQSISYWAPANIGPYSQAISTQLLAPAPATKEEEEEEEEEVASASEPPRLIHLAGQIPLFPCSMLMPPKMPFPNQTALALQHVWRVARATRVRWFAVGVAFIADCEPDEASYRVQIAQEAWRGIHDSRLAGTNAADGEDNEADPWDALNLASPVSDTTFRAPLPDRAVLAAASASATQLHPPCFVAQVSSLPRRAAIEWACTGLSSGADASIAYVPGTALPTTSTSVAGTEARFVTLEFKDEEEDRKMWARVVAGLQYGTLYTAPNFPLKEVREVLGMQWVPCKAVWGRDAPCSHASHESSCTTLLLLHNTINAIHTTHPTPLQGLVTVKETFPIQPSPSSSSTANPTLTHKLHPSHPTSTSPSPSRSAYSRSRSEMRKPCGAPQRQGRVHCSPPEGGDVGGYVDGDGDVDGYTVKSERSKDSRPGVVVVALEGMGVVKEVLVEVEASHPSNAAFSSAWLRIAYAVRMASIVGVASTCPWPFVAVTLVSPIPFPILFPAAAAVRGVLSGCAASSALRYAALRAWEEGEGDVGVECKVGEARPRMW
ncbi:hypothetical protein BDV95DRAFT_590396 [Massariosphaeria phaeospora]|uniref:Diphthine--ammonia ligase n=1 Tax=Massariosphaeria phaeospora TaxID=100035 RepID=A0A7C8ICN3_9PLEO|nr:hypothetical protein BDV95DRAFT_590396 [Massariosphaeria phaeospora]